ncbi:hypothetical protein [Amnibacterium kyonggiense]
MKIGDEEFETFAAFVAREREKARRNDGQRLLREARAQYASVEDLIDRVQLIPGGIAAAIDKPFAVMNTFLPSSSIRTQLRLAIHYIRAGDARGHLRCHRSSFYAPRSNVPLLHTGYYRAAAIAKALHECSDVCGGTH